MKLRLFLGRSHQNLQTERGIVKSVTKKRFKQNNLREV